MEFFLDTANIGEIRRALSWGVISGVTTNPSLISKEEKPFKDLAQEICQMIRQNGAVSFELSRRMRRE